MDRDNLLSVLSEDRDRISKAINSILSMPELLREILDNLKALNENINKLYSKMPSKEIIEKPETVVVKPPEYIGEVSLKPYKTKLYIKYDFSNVGYYQILDIKGEGVVREIAIVSDSPHYNIKLTIDQYTELMTFGTAIRIQKYIDFIDAIITVDGYYLFKLHDVYFQNNFSIGVSSDERIRYEYIVGVYDVL